MNLSGFPVGLLSLLDAQNFGENPRVAADSFSPIIDATGLFMTNKQVLEPRALATVANGPNTAWAVTVPAGELWYIHWAAVFATTGAGDAIGRLWITYFQDGGQFAISPTVPVMGANASEFAIMSVQPFWAVPGSRIGVFCVGVAGATPQASGGFLVTKLRR